MRNVKNMWKFCRNFVEGGKVFAGAIHLHRSTRGAKHRDRSDNDATMQRCGEFFDTCVDAGQQLSLYHTTAHNWCFPQFEVEVLRSDAKP